MGQRPVDQRLKKGSVFSTRAALTERQLGQTVLQSRAEALSRDFQLDSPPQASAHPTLALV